MTRVARLQVELVQTAMDPAPEERFVRLASPPETDPEAENLIVRLTFTITQEVLDMARYDPKRFVELLERKVREAERELQGPE